MYRIMQVKYRRIGTLSKGKESINFTSTLIYANFQIDLESDRLPSAMCH